MYSLLAPCFQWKLNDYAFCSVIPTGVISQIFFRVFIDLEKTFDRGNLEIIIKKIDEDKCEM